ncbi:hypothetical protein P152DRAFT_460163 [Eremomyces bilateralis CBS 781.70]|uniref:Uncharacterized protein n=1 Tax=Eremomyces bilateralis CBS 781.70 TaxID=1392243 RepID=A0A6G1FYC3_9PEZI|nr:uncharacterized protein P152DRAFT_462467 [Eremomyces bilateralis CBS 781.70]XP_033532496.1 uncharacterized protein P152DRAFT_460163 [Eremomyces bilateralis CBS 781.70]KAF1808471.1 hypothetical protein P152DRAFT_462467 [Eremomyces bilateralis CBS 781.70]KAF1810865.1 hypothetical protein P152DRAFT_460163 [Eremomyces bilateralis CBS 781.70]
MKCFLILTLLASLRASASAQPVLDKKDVDLEEAIKAYNAVLNPEKGASPLGAYKDIIDAADARQVLGVAGTRLYGTGRVPP